MYSIRLQIDSIKMFSSSYSSSIQLGSNLGFQKPLNLCRNRFYLCSFKVSEIRFGTQKCDYLRNWSGIKAMDEFSDGFSSFDEWGDSDGISGGGFLSRDSYILSSSGDESDTEVVVNPIGDVDLPSTNERFESSDGALAVTAHRFSMLRRRHATNRIQPGNIINMGLVAFLVTILLLVDWCSWRIVRLPLASFYLSRPFFISAVLALIAGWLSVPILKKFKIYQTIKKKGPRQHYLKKGTPTMGGLFFIPIGITVAGYIVGFSSVEVFGAAVATLAFAAIGLLDDTFSVINKRNFGLPAWIKLMLEVAVGLGFTYWLNSANISSPYSMYSFS